jgi:hypothetical protein
MFTVCGTWVQFNGMSAGACINAGEARSIVNLANVALAAEREWSKALYQNLDDEKKSHRKSLDALLQAQAAIADAKDKINGIFFASHSRFAEFLQILSNVDLSVLDKHDADVRKPLMEALNDAIGYLDDKNSTGNHSSMIVELQDAVENKNFKTEA